MKNLVIVESPTKAKTLKTFLGSEYDVIATKGHILDLPNFRFGVKIDNKSFVPEYEIEKNHKAIANDIKELAKNSQKIYIATDEDREGEAIGYHIANMLNLDITKTPRVVFHEITKNAILNSFKTPRIIDTNIVNAQQARRVLDRIVGYKLSPLLSSKLQSGLSAGRVQSSALKLIVDREREIRKFVIEEYYTIEGIFEDILEASLIEYQNKKVSKITKDDSQKIVETLSQEEFSISKIEKKEKKTDSPEPLMTSTLQQLASSMFGFSAKMTMQIAQSLYEGIKIGSEITGLITYMRTDSLFLSKDSVNKAREHILNSFGEKYLPAKAKSYKTKNQKAQEAHEAIRPTVVDYTPSSIRKYLKDDEFKLYSLIYNRFVASQMESAIFETSSVVVSSESSKFRGNARRLVFDGFYAVLGYDEKDTYLPNIEKITKYKISAKQHFTQPPSRFTEATLIKQLEALGIGRPSTYAPTISTLTSRDYIEIEKKQLAPTDIAFKVTELLEEHFLDIVDSNFTAKMEDELDKIGENTRDWQVVLADFYEPFIKNLNKKQKEIVSQKVVIPTGENCPKCGLPLVKRVGKYGEFVSCSGYPKCKHIQKAQEKIVVSDVKCNKCGSDMIVKASKNGEFLACSNYPKCKNTKSLTKIDIKCPLCGKELLEKSSKKGKFFGCSGYPDCNFLSRELPSDIKCPKCNFATIKKELKTKSYYQCLNKDCKHKEDIQQ
jgi:DNA topoisomerase-1